MQTETIVLNACRNVVLAAYLQQTKGEFGFTNRPAILILPGGGYAMCSDREADPVAMAYLKAGFQAFILRYSTGEHRAWPNPLQDYEQAMCCIKEKAESWGVDPDRIAAVGFSAGGHLCACAATIAAHKPAAAVLVYPAILKEICDMCQPGMPYPHEHVSADTSPCFLAAARDDRTVSIQNTLSMQTALAEKGITFESHIYSYGGHGFSTAEDWVTTSSITPRAQRWVTDSIDWLKEVFGALTAKGFTEPNPALILNADAAPRLSISCTLDHIRTQSPAVQDIIKPLYDRMKAIADARQYSMEGLLRVTGGNTIRELMEMAGSPAEEIRTAAAALRLIENRIE